MTQVAWLRGLGEDGLAALLRRRPEALAAPVPADLAELADRLDTPASVLAALRRLDRPTLQVAEAIAALGGHADQATLERLLGAADPETAQQVSRAVARLAECALLAPEPAADLATSPSLDLTTGPILDLVPVARAAWPDPLRLGPPVAQAMTYRTAQALRELAYGLGLRPATRKADLLDQVVAALRNPDLVRAVVDRAQPAARDLLRDAIVTGRVVRDVNYYSPSYQQQDACVRWATERGLLVRANGWDGDLVVPAEVALALRGDSYHAPFDPVPPACGRADVDAVAVARDAAAAGSSFVRLAAALLDEAGRTPLTLLRSGGIGARELRRLTKQLAVDEPDVRLALTLACEAGLLSTADGGATPTAGYDRWLRGEPPQRLAELMAAWWRLGHASLVAEGAWLPDRPADGTVGLRRAVLAVAAEPPGGAIRDPAALAERIVWTQPYAFGDPDTAVHRALACWQEARLLGVVGSGAVSAAGRALLDDGCDLAAALSDVGAAERTVRLQADLTAVVAGTPAAGLAALLDAAADAESRGAASTWRFSPTSVRRALDAGYTASDLLAELSAVSVGAVPQPLEYLIGDVARRHGAVRASAVACCLCSDDPTLLAEITADRRLGKLGLRRLAPTVLATDTPLADTLAALRDAGYAPVGESSDGMPILERPPVHRTAGPARARRGGRAAGRGRAVGASGGRARSRAAQRTGEPAPEPVDVARALLAAPDSAATTPSPTVRSVLDAAVNLTPGESRMLADAIENGGPVAITYVSANGNTTARVIEELELSDDSLWAWCRLRDDHRWFKLGRVLSVTPATETDEPDPW